MLHPFKTGRGADGIQHDCFRVKAMNTTIDRHNRIIDYLRISVTDRCNLRCIYCMPAGGLRPYAQEEVLGFEEITRIVRTAAKLGVTRVRITGGEPLIRPDLPVLIGAIRNIAGIKDIALTTNGTLLKKHARALSEAGLQRVNISLDSLRPERFSRIRRGARLEDVLEGLSAAQEVGFNPVKINMVPIKNLNDDEIEDFASLTLTAPVHVRFIELMPTGSGTFWSRERCIPTSSIRKRIALMGTLTPLLVPQSGPASHYRLQGAVGVIGFISTITHRFCASCNRLRLTCEGKLKPCLFSDREIDLRSPLRAGASDEEIESILRLAVALKPKNHELERLESFEHLRPMSKIGG